MWGRVEHLAMSNPGYQLPPKQQYLYNNNSNIVTSPPGGDDDPDISYEKLEQEAREVSKQQILNWEN